MDGDGWLDIAVASSSDSEPQSALYLNDGRGDLPRYRPRCVPTPRAEPAALPGRRVGCRRHPPLRRGRRRPQRHVRSGGRAGQRPKPGLVQRRFRPFQRQA
ncbi:MAG: VCBS repeat-containing protein [Anaerolineae bacterium]|nr:MAG: VCBS repeat-containing protein [Anaerolineae bacterium]